MSAEKKSDIIQYSYKAKAKASCEATLKKASEKAKVLPGGPSFQVDKSSITDPNNITIV